MFNSKFSKEDEAGPEDDTRSNEVLVLFRVGGSVGLLIKLPRGSVLKKKKDTMFLLFLSCQNKFLKKETRGSLTYRQIERLSCCRKRRP